MKIMSATKTIRVPEYALVNILKSLPENILADIFWKTFVKSDDAPLTKTEKIELTKAKDEYRKHETIKWQDIR